MSKEAMKLALEALTFSKSDSMAVEELIDDAIVALEEALAKQEQGEPVAYDVRCDNCGGNGYDPKNNNYYCSSCEGSGFLEKLLHTTPQQRTWVGLTKEDIVGLFPNAFLFNDCDYNTDKLVADVRRIEAKLKEKNSA